MDYSPADIAAVKRELKKHFGWAIANCVLGTVFLVSLIVLPHERSLYSVACDIVIGLSVAICYGKMGFRLAIMGFVNALGPRN